MTKDVVHGQHTQQITPPEQAGGKFTSTDADRRIKYLLDTGLPMWLFVAEEDKWHAELYSEYFFSKAAELLEPAGGVVETLEDKPGQKVAKQIKEQGSTRTKYTKYYKEMGYGHASWGPAYQEPELASFLLSSKTSGEGRK